MVITSEDREYCSWAIWQGEGRETYFSLCTHLYSLVVHMKILLKRKEKYWSAPRALRRERCRSRGPEYGSAVPLRLYLGTLGAVLGDIMQVLSLPPGLGGHQGDLGKAWSFLEEQKRRAGSMPTNYSDTSAAPVSMNERRGDAVLLWPSLTDDQPVLRAQGSLGRV